LKVFGLLRESGGAAAQARGRRRVGALIAIGRGESPIIASATALFIAMAGRDAQGLMAHRDELFRTGADAFFLIATCIGALVLALFGLLFTCFAFSAWFKSTRVTVDSKGVYAHDHWLSVFHRSRHFAPGDIDHFEIEIHTSTTTPSGTHEFWDVQIYLGAQPPPGQTPDPSTVIILAKNIAGKEEAQWLADQMACALGRQPYRAPV